MHSYGCTQFYVLSMLAPYALTSKAYRQFPTRGWSSDFPPLSSAFSSK